jgi:hypothetical protein
VNGDPGVTFSAWAPWSDRRRLRRDDGPWLGLYLWGRFERPPDEADRPYPVLPRQVIYVGETKHIDLRPLTGDHHRLAHYRDTFPDDDGLKLLYITVGRVERFPDGYEGAEARSTYRRLRVFTQYIEAKIYWEYTKQWNCPPALHYKKSRKTSLDS